MSGKSMAKTQAGWERLLAGIEANKESLPEIAAFCAALGAQLTNLKAELARRSVMQAEVRRSTCTITESLEAGGELASRISHYLRARYGRGSGQLVEFGLNPSGKRRKGSPETCHHG